LLAVSGGGGILVLVILTKPELLYRWMFFFFFMLAVSGIMLPAVAYLHKRFEGDDPIDPGAIAREACFFGVYGNLILWLQLGHSLNPMLALLLALGFVLVEIFLRMNERSRWKPKDQIDHE
jgi:hypothetical protein